MTNLHVQCRLKRGETEQVAWIPKKHAFAGAVVKLKQEDDGWSDGWFVIEANKTCQIESKFIQERSMDWKKMRSVTDI